VGFVVYLMGIMTGVRRNQMPKFTPQDKHIAELYKKALIIHQKKQIEFESHMEEEAQKDLDSNFWAYLPARIQNLCKGVNQLNQMNIPKGKIDEMERDVGDFVTMVGMYSHPEVIIQLINEESERVGREKMLEKVKSS